MKMLTTILIFMMSIRCFAPGEKCFYLQKPQEINPFKGILKAVGTTESKMDVLAFNHIEDARGLYQIRAIRLIDYNQKTGKNYCRWDLFNPEVQKEIFLYYAFQFGPYRIDELIKAWNGRGSATVEYLKRVKKLIQ
jgi:hypothetical protein